MASKRTVRGALPEHARGKPLEVWFQDEARIGQKNKITRRWAKRGTRPSAPRDQRTASTYIFGSVCPKQGKGAALILPTCNTEAMNLHLVEIAATVAQVGTLLVDEAQELDPAQRRLVRLRRGESARRRELHVERRRSLLEALSSLGINCVLVSDSSIGHVLDAFLAWSTERQASWGAAA